MTVSPTGDAARIRRWKEGDPDAARSLLRSNLDWVVAYVRKRLGPRAPLDTEDVVHDAIVRFLRAKPTYVPASRAEFRALLGSIALNVLRDRFASIGRERRLTTDEITQGLNSGALGGAITPPEEAAARDEWRDWVHVGLELVSPEDRELIRARVWSEASFAEIATRFAIPSENAARMRFQRALGRLAREIDRVRRGTE